MRKGDYVKQLTYLLFLKMADERSQPPYNQNANQPGMIPKAERAKPFVKSCCTNVMSIRCCGCRPDCFTRKA